MNYRRWPPTRKIAYWLAMAALVASACFLLTNKGFGPSSASPPDSGSLGSALSATNPGSPRTDAGVATDLPAAAGTTASTAAGAAHEIEPSSPPGPVAGVPRKTLVARLNGDVPGSPSPGAASTQVVPGSWYGYPSILPVIAKQPNWLEVRLAQRPNGSTTWIPASDASVSKDHYAIVVDLATMHLSVFLRGRVIDSFPAGIGKPTSPTPPGNFFVAMTVPPPSPGYGPLVLVTSAHSNAITDWDNSGDAIIAIHGPIDTPADTLIGTTGAAVSDGCVRLHDADLAQLSVIPPGTPVDIVSS
jgi:lipoprotein-anchoring transpeptidase ErfK/SrfK